MASPPEIDTYSPTWRAVKAFAEERRAQHRRLLEAPGLAQAETEHLRGALRELAALLALAEPPRIRALHSTTESVE